MTGLTAEIALEGTGFAFDILYTYAIPPEMQRTAKKGCRVLVPFGKGNIKRQGMIFRLKEQEIKGLKKLYSLIDSEPVLSEEMLSLCEYLHETVFCTYYDAVQKMLPVGLSYSLIDLFEANGEFADISLLSENEKQIYELLSAKGQMSRNAIKNTLGIDDTLLSKMVENEVLLKSSDAKRRMGDATQKWVRLCDEDITDLKFTARQKEVVNLLLDAGAASVKEICYFTGVSAAVIENLVKKGILISFEKQVFRTPYKSAEPDRREICLTDEQQTAFNGLFDEYQKQSGATSLLYGITGSGKTQVFLKLADAVLDDGKGVIVMVPEIALTPQLISIFTARYGNKIAVFHSAMSMGQRMDEWRRIKDGKATIAIGTRSAVFAPFDNLGLIIIDEEQEHTYRSEQSPRFHTRDVAKFRTAKHKGLLCLASATPSLETYAAAKSGKYSLFTLTHRYGNAVLPKVETVDMKKELADGNSGVLSRSLYEKIKETVEKGNQAILLLNRRGHNTYISCPECGNVASCPNCSISLTYHSANERLMCHYCGYSIKLTRTCSECGSEHMKFTGLGTQKAEEELKALFPNARILRLDADSTMTRDSYSNYLSAFAKGSYDILLGTQMVAKGLDFPKVTLVGVLGADRAMYSEDFRSFERTFSLLTQVVGRAGRGDTAGCAVVQTLDPDSNLIELASRQDYDTFFSEEILTRKLLVYPPYCDICVVSARATLRENAEKAVKEIFKEIKRLIESEYKDVKLIILGPSPASIPKIQGRYRFRMIIKCKNNAKFREMLKSALKIKLSGDTAVWVDINPETVI